MVIKQKRIIVYLILILVLIFSIILIVLNFLKGPIFIINNCNGNIVTNSKLCYNSKDYYYLDNNGIIHRVSDNKDDIFYDADKFEYISCNSNYLYAADKNCLFKIDFNGVVINSIEIDSWEQIYSEIYGIYASEDYIFCVTGSSYLVIDPISLTEMSVNSFIDDRTWLINDEAIILSGNGIKIVSAHPPIDPINSGFTGIIMLNDAKMINLRDYHIIGFDEIRAIEYAAYNGTTFTDLSNKKEYILPLTDIRHCFINDDFLISFSSSYNTKSIISNLCFLKYNYSAQDFGRYDDFPLTLHNEDVINIINLKTGTLNTIKTKAGEKIVYLCDEKAVTYYDGNYLFYNLENWNCYKSTDASGIDSHSKYIFETCDDYVFVFDDSTGEMIDRINVQ